MPKVVVYVPAADARALESEGLDVAEWVRDGVRGLLSVRQGNKPLLPPVNPMNALLAERDQPDAGKARAGVASSAARTDQMSSELAQGTGGNAPARSASDGSAPGGVAAPSGVTGAEVLTNPVAGAETSKRSVCTIATPAGTKCKTCGKVH